MSVCHKKFKAVIYGKVMLDADLRGMFLRRSCGGEICGGV